MVEIVTLMACEPERPKRPGHRCRHFDDSRDFNKHSTTVLSLPIPFSMSAVSTSSNQTARIPVVNFGQFLHGVEADRKVTASAIDQAFRDCGFVYLSNHGILQEKIDKCFEWSKAFFALPDDIKMKAPHPSGGSHHRGYSGLGEEKVTQMVFDKDEIAKAREDAPDVKESFESGNVNDHVQPNIWLPEEDLPGFRDFMQEFFLVSFDFFEKAMVDPLNRTKTGLF